MLTNVVGGDMKKEREEVRTLVYATWYWSLRVSGRRDADGVHVGLLKSTWFVVNLKVSGRQREFCSTSAGGLGTCIALWLNCPVF